MTNTLAIDIGGTKIAMATFEGSRLVHRDEWLTDREHGHDGVLPQVVRVAREWQAEMNFTACGVGFGGPVDFDRQRVSLSTHVRGWDDFPLSDNLEDALGIPAIIDNDANVAALGEAKFGAGRDAMTARRPMFVYDGLDRNRRRSRTRRWQRVPWREFVGRGNRPHDDSPRRTGLLVRLKRMSGANVQRPLARKGLWAPAKQSFSKTAHS